MKASLTELEVSSWFEIGKEIRILFLRKHLIKFYSVHNNKQNPPYWQEYDFIPWYFAGIIYRQVKHRDKLDISNLSPVKHEQNTI